MHLIFSLLGLLVSVLATAFGLVLWLLRMIYQAKVIVGDMWSAREYLATGVLRCPRGHEIPIDNEVYECKSCGFTWHGSMLHCPNVECSAPSTPFVSCPTCQLSIRSPLRWGRP